MAGVSDKQLSRMGPFVGGVANVMAETDLPVGEEGEIISLRAAVNVDIPNSGVPERRAGYRKVVAGVDMHSGWRDGQLPFALFVDDGTLYAMMEGGDPWAVRAGLHRRDVSYALINGRVYWSNGRQSGIVLPDGEALPWGVDTPNGQPTLGLDANGGLFAGIYQVAITYRDTTGEESGTGLAATITVPEGGGITLSSIPQPNAANILVVRIYVSQANGDMLYFARDIPVGMLSTTLGQGGRGKPLDSQFLDQMPDADIVRSLNGRAYVARGNVMNWSEALRYGLYHPVHNRMTVGSKITLLEPIADGTDAAGLFVADEKRTYFFGGSDPARFSKRIAYPYPAIPGTGAHVPASVFGQDSSVPAVYWIATNGVACLGLPGGQVLALKDKVAVAPNATYGATLFREFKGMRQMITTLRETTPRKFAVADRAVATIYRNGVEVDE